MIVEEKKINSDEIYNGYIVHVFKDEVSLDGKKAFREVVRHKGATAVLAVDKNGEGFFVEQFRYPVGKPLFEVPAGKIDPGEEPFECAKRELFEKRISETLEHIIESRQIYQHKSGEPNAEVLGNASGQYLSIVAPIISEGDVSGCVAFVYDGAEAELGETGYKLAQTVAGFLGRQMES